ncbi:Putative Molybdopterin oxidoreductase subunit protein [Minicystis rosea]|nr:Putative Molybdopterin oxidoreductase subunit protein [Minicystis rosea]
MPRYLFPRWSNKVLPMAVLFGLGPVGTALVGGLWYYGTNKHLEVGYAPVQPIEYSHKLHAGDLGIDCRYCHSTVEKSGFAQIPPTETCMNCHAKVRTDSLKLLGVRESYASDKPIPWIKIHNLPDYVYFDHSAHLNAGVGCASCHGRVDQMVRVQQEKPLSMGWCLECHRDPTAHLRDDKSEVTKMDWTGPSKAVLVSTGVATINGRTVHPPTHCSGCHR